MEEWKRNAALAVLAGAVLAKLLLPELPKRVSETLFPDTDYRAAMETLSRRISLVRRERDSTGTADQQFERDLIPAPAAEPTAPEPAALSPKGVLGEEVADASGERPPRPEDLPPVVRTFLKEQAALCDGPLPEDVDYTCPELPFAYTQPIPDWTGAGFGYRVHPILEEMLFHYGSDVAAGAGTDIHAFAAGTVSFAGVSDSFGNYLVLDHGDGWTSLYAHCSYLFVKTGQTVDLGERIALIGATGHVTGPHLHFELRRDGFWFNPEYYINS